MIAYEMIRRVIQILPPNCLSKPLDSTSERLFEALYPKVNAPDDTRHFVVDPSDEQPAELNFNSDQNLHAEKFEEF